MAGTAAKVRAAETAAEAAVKVRVVDVKKAKAALVALLTGKKVDDIDFRIPDGETMHMQIESVTTCGDAAIATVVKDAGDDPDVTNRSRISVKVSYAQHEGIRFFGGEGIGTVTILGLGLPVGEAAINPIPRAMM